MRFNESANYGNSSVQNNTSKIACSEYLDFNKSRFYEFFSALTPHIAQDDLIKLTNYVQNAHRDNAQAMELRITDKGIRDNAEKNFNGSPLCKILKEYGIKLNVYIVEPLFFGIFSSNKVSIRMTMDDILQAFPSKETIEKRFSSEFTNQPWEKKSTLFEQGKANFDGIIQKQNPNITTQNNANNVAQKSLFSKADTNKSSNNKLPPL